MKRWVEVALAIGLLAVAGGAGLLCARSEAPREQVLASAVSDLAHRSPGQVANALSAAHLLDGAVVRPNGVFSLNRRIGPWTADRGYHRAPVSYDGELTLAVGGGVCQLSTTLYQAALKAGMDIVERHRHFWPVSYARPGLDAAVAFPGIDLQFRNPLPAAVRIRARSQGDRLLVELDSAAASGPWDVEAEQLAVHPPATLVRRSDSLAPGQVVRANRGQAGRQVAVYRLHRARDGQWERTLVSIDSYPVLNRIVKVGGQP